MKKKNKIILGVGIAAAAVGIGIMVYRTVRRRQADCRQAKVADEGYETAHDILFPGKSQRKKVHYGPVFPA